MKRNVKQLAAELEYMNKECIEEVLKTEAVAPIVKEPTMHERIHHSQPPAIGFGEAIHRGRLDKEIYDMLYYLCMREVQKDMRGRGRHDLWWKAVQNTPDIMSILHPDVKPEEKWPEDKCKYNDSVPCEDDSISHCSECVHCEED